MASDDEITPLHSTGSYPVWRTAAEELSRELEPFCTGPRAEEALSRRERSLEFLDTFERWSPNNRPDDETRSLAIASFLAFHRQTRDLLVEWRGARPRG